MALIQTIKNRLGHVVYPRTLTSAVSDKNGKNVDEKFAELNNALEEAGTVRYNPLNDIVEVKYNGEWHEWKTGNMQTFYLYNEGEEVVDLDLNGYILDTNTTKCVPSRNADTISLTALASTVYSSATVFTNEKFDLRDYTRLYALITNNGKIYQLDLDVTDVSEGYIAVTHQRNGSSAAICVERLSVVSTKANNFASYKIAEATATINAAGTDELTSYLEKVWVK